MADINVKISGAEDILKFLDKVADELKKSAEVAVLKAGAKPILEAAKGFAASSVKSGRLLESLGINVKKGKDGVTTARIGPRGGRRIKIGTARDRKTGRMKDIFADPNKYSHLVEFGTSHSAAHPFIRPANDAAGPEVVEAMGESIDKYLTRTVKRLKK